MVEHVPSDWPDVRAWTRGQGGLGAVRGKTAGDEDGECEDSLHVDSLCSDVVMVSGTASA